MNKTELIAKAKLRLRKMSADTLDEDVEQAGFTIAFAKDSETVIDAEFKAQPMDKEGTLITYQEEMDVTAASGE